MYLPKLWSCRLLPRIKSLHVTHALASASQRTWVHHFFIEFPQVLYWPEWAGPIPLTVPHIYFSCISHSINIYHRQRTRHDLVRLVLSLNASCLDCTAPKRDTEKRTQPSSTVCQVLLGKKPHLLCSGHMTSIQAGRCCVRSQDAASYFDFTVDLKSWIFFSHLLLWIHVFLFCVCAIALLES